MSSVLASISLVRAKLGRYVLVLAKVVRVCVLVCDVGNPRVGGGGWCTPYIRMMGMIVVFSRGL